MFDVKLNSPSILFIIDHLDTGGAPVVVRDLMIGLVEQGASVSLMVLSDRIAHTLPPKVTVARLPFNPRHRLERWQRYHFHAKALNKWLDKHSEKNFDLVVAHLHHAHQVVSRSKLAHQAWYCLHSDPVIGFLGNKQGFARCIKRSKVARLYNGKKLIGVSNGLLKRLFETFNVQAEEKVCLHNPLNLKVIREKSLELVEKIPTDYLVFVGRLDQRAKRFDRLLTAYRDSKVDLPLLLIGEGSDRLQIETMIREMALMDRVFLLGHHDNPFPYIRGAHALLLSSDYEGFSLVIAEALACGTPVVSTDCPSGPAEIMCGELVNFLVPLEDTEAYVDAILRVLTHPPVIVDSYLDAFSLEYVTKRYLALANKPRNC